MKTNINLKINLNTKKIFKDLCNKSNVSMSCVLNTYIVKLINCYKEREQLKKAITNFYKTAPSYQQMAEAQGIYDDADVANMITSMRRNKKN